MRSLRIIFMGSPEFAVPSLERLSHSQHKVITVVSLPDKRRSRRGKPEPTEVKKRALELSLNVLETGDLRSNEVAAQLASLKPDLIVVVAFQILPEQILQIPTLGAINLHASLLPRYRGAAPIHHAVMNGEKETGCTVFFLNERVDTGEIIDSVKTEIGGNETTGDLYGRLKLIGAELLGECVDRIADESVVSLPQNDEEATPAPKLFRENTEIDFTKSAREVHNQVRGLNPFPVAWTMRGEEQVNVHRTQLVSEGGLEPGQLRRENDRLLCGCGTGSVELLELQLPGRKKMSGLEFMNGYSLEERLGGGV